MSYVFIYFGPLRAFVILCGPQMKNLETSEIDYKL